MVISEERYKEIFSYPNKPEDRELFHRTFAGVIHEDDYLSPTCHRLSPLTLKEMSERKAHNKKILEQ